jgi:CBS domain containing-hemolysin-like protein
VVLDDGGVSRGRDVGHPLGLEPLAESVTPTEATLVAMLALSIVVVFVLAAAETALLFVYGEAIPKTFAVRQPLVVARRLAVPIRWLSIVLRPIVSVLVRLADAQLPGTGITTVTAVSEEELRHLADEAASAGSIEESDVELIERAFMLGDLRVNQILIPRVDIVAVSGDTPVADALRVAIAAGHRRLPVFNDGIDQITGFVTLRDLADSTTANPDTVVAERAREVLVVPESKRVIELLRAMQESGRHLAVVVDEYGGTEGIVTIEDAVEKLVGPIDDPWRPDIE